MDCKISPNFWPDMEDQTAEVKLTYLWCLTNAETAHSLLGVFTWRPRRYEYDTGLDAEYFQKTVAAMPRALLLVDDHVWVRHYIRYQLGTGSSLVANRNIVKGLVRRLQALPRGLQAPLLEAYPELRPLASPLQAPSNGFAGVEAEGLQQSLTGPEGPETALPPEAPRRGPYRAEQHRVPPSGECEGGAVIPAEAEVVGFGKAWGGDAARGIPAQMPEGYVLSWLAWRMGETAPPFPRDWQADLSRRFIADWVKKTRGTRHEAKAAAAAPDQAALVQELARTKEPGRRAALLQQLKGAAA